jgi:hypothetical protein
LNFFTGLEDLKHFPNEFFFEPVVSMGRNAQITRVRLFGIHHMELSDMSLFDIRTREGIYLMGGGRVEGSQVQDIIATFCLAFIGSLLHEQVWDAATVADGFKEAELFDISYVSDWAATAFEGQDLEDQTEAPSDHASVDAPTSGAKMIQQAASMVAFVSAALFF